jgi:DNA-binding NtrC family response regulator
MKRILVIDDEEPILRHFRDLLRLLQYDPILANNSDEGALKAQDPEISMIISDLCMPGRLKEMDHIRELRRLRPDIPMVVISGYPTPEVLQECEELGIEDFLTKPFELSFISSVLARLLPVEPGEDP